MASRYPALRKRDDAGTWRFREPMTPFFGNEGKGTGRPAGWLRQIVSAGKVLCRDLARVVARPSPSRSLAGLARGVPPSLGPHERKPSWALGNTQETPHGFPVQQGDVMIHRP
jgi:hypothetical protein